MRKRKAAFAALVAVAVVAAFALPAFSSPGQVGSAAGFEDDDGNLAPAGAINFDWNSFAPTTWTGTAPHRTAAKTTSGWQFTGLEDAQATTSDDGFAGGTKQDNECASVISAKADNKADLKRIYLTSKTIAGHTYLMLAWVRIPQNTTSPSAHVAFEFNQSSTLCGAGHGGLVHRSAANGGDMLIVYDFEGGSDTPTLRLERWVASGACEISSHSAPCWGTATTLTAGTAEAAVNATSSVGDSIAPTSETLGIKEFGEAGIDLTNAGVFGTNQCTTFGKAFGVSRTSGNSGTAQMKDLVGPGNFTLTNCASVNVTKTGSDGGSQAGAVFTLYSGTGTGGTVIGTCTVDATGQCGSNPSFGNLVPGTYTLDETTVPNGYTKDASLPDTFTLNAGDSINKAYVNTAAPGTINISKTDDANNPLAGATFTIYSPAGISNGVPTGSAVASCTTGAGGGCSISNVTPGTYTIDESVVPTGYAKDPALPQNITVHNGETLNLSFSDPRLFKMIVIVCQQSDNTLHPSAVTIDGQSEGNSLSSAQAANKGLSESALCGITQGARGNRQAGDHAADPVSIP